MTRPSPAGSDVILRERLSRPKDLLRGDYQTGAEEILRFAQNDTTVAGWQPLHIYPTATQSTPFA